MTIIFRSGVLYTARKSSAVDCEIAITRSARFTMFRKFTKKCQTLRFQEKVSGNSSNERSCAVTTSLVFLESATKFRFGRKNKSTPPSMRSIFGQPRYQKQKLSSLLGQRKIRTETCGYFSVHEKSSSEASQAFANSLYEFSVSCLNSSSSRVRAYSSTPERTVPWRHRASIPILITTSPLKIQNSSLALSVPLPTSETTTEWSPSKTRRNTRAIRPYPPPSPTTPGHRGVPGRFRR